VSSVLFCSIQICIRLIYSNLCMVLAQVHLVNWASLKWLWRPANFDVFLYGAHLESTTFSFRSNLKEPYYFVAIKFASDAMFFPEYKIAIVSKHLHVKLLSINIFEVIFPHDDSNT
jgi:hypothetical protein